MSETFRGRPARRPVSTTRNEPLLQWASQLTTKDRRLYSGWLVESGRDNDLDDAVARAGFTPIVIKHGGGNFVTHWEIPSATIIPIIEQVDTLQTIKSTNERSGMALGWREGKDMRNQSFLKMFVYLVPLLEVGWEHPLILTAKSTLTDDVCGALMRHYDLIDFAEASRRKQGKPPANFTFYAFSVTLSAGEEVRRGSNVQKDFTPVVNAMPDPVTPEWARESYVGNNQRYMQLVESRMEEAIQWSILASQQTGPTEVHTEE